MGSTVKKTMIMVLLDESGSMSDLRNDVIGGINSFIDDQRKLPDPAVIAIANFGTHIDKGIWFSRPMIDLKEVQKLTEADYAPNGGTPLLDATGRSILALDDDWRREKPDRCIFVCFTDGRENASQEFSKAKIKALQAAREKSGLWVFLFMGANIDSFAEGASLGYKMSNTANYTASPQGFRAAAKKMSESTYSLRGASVSDYAEASMGLMDIGLGGDIGEDGSVSKTTGGASVTVNTGPTPPPGQPPAAAMVTEDWTAPTSSALFDPKMETWKVPQ